MVTFLTLTRQFFLHTTPIDVINSWGISKMYATQIVKNVNGERLVRDHQIVLPVKWALWDQALGIDRPSDGHPLPVRCAQSAQTLGNFWATLILSQNYNKFGTKQCFCTKKLLILMPI